MTTQDTHGPPIPVVSQTRGQAIRRSLASATLTAGLLIVALQDAAPHLALAFPSAKWIPQLIAGLGAAVLTFQKLKDSWGVTSVNLSTPTRDMRDSIPADASTQTVQPPTDVSMDIHSLPATSPLPLVPTAIGTFTDTSGDLPKADD